MNFFSIFFSVFFLSFAKLHYFMLQNLIISCYGVGKPKLIFNVLFMLKAITSLLLLSFFSIQFCVFAPSSWSSYLFIEFIIIIIIINSWNLHYFIMKCYAMNIFTIAWSNSFINLNFKNRWFSHSHCCIQYIISVHQQQNNSVFSFIQIVLNLMKNLHKKLNN